MIRIADVPVPEPGPGEVRLRVRAAALNHLDLWTRRGLPIEIEMPHIGGSDIAGEVEAHGPGTEHVPLGTRVVVDPSLAYDWYDRGSAEAPLASGPFRVIGEHTQGGFAEFVVVPAANLVALPDSVSFKTAAAAALVFVTAWHALTARARVRAGEHVLITGGSGGVSTAGIQIAKLCGARVSVVTSGDGNVRRVRELGADVVYDRLTTDFGKAVWADTNKRGVDVVLDSVGQATWKECVRALAPRGRLVCYGGTTGPQGTIFLPLLFWKQLSILGSTMGSPAEFRAVMRLVFERRLRPVIHDVLPLDEARRAHELLEDGAVFGKLVLEPQAEPS